MLQQIKRPVGEPVSELAQYIFDSFLNEHRFTLAIRQAREEDSRLRRQILEEKYGEFGTELAYRLDILELPY